MREYGKTDADGVDGRATTVERRKFLLPSLNADDGRGRRGNFQ